MMKIVCVGYSESFRRKIKEAQREHREMDILLITPKTFPYLSGNTITVERIAHNLRKQGIRASVATPQTATRVIAARKPDLLHFFHGVKSHIGETNIPYVLTFTGTDINADIDDSEKRLVLKQMIEQAHTVTAFKGEDTEALSQKLGITVPELTIIPQAVELPETYFRFREPFGIPADATLFLLVAGIRPVKDPRFAVSELAELRISHPEIRLVILGERDDSMLAEEIERFGKGWVSIAKLPHEHMRSAYREADIVLNTSESEGQSNAVLEALSLGRRILCTDIPGNVMVPQQYRFPKVRGALAALAERILRNPAPPQYHYRIPNSDTEVQAYLAVYRRVIGETDE